MRKSESALRREIGKRIRLTRHAIWGRDRQTCMAATGASTNMISRWEKGQSFPDFLFVAKLYEDHDVSADWIINGKMNRLPGDLIEKILAEMQKK